MTIQTLGAGLQEKLYGQMTLIRKYEERIFELFDAGELFGTTHGYIGQEAVAVGVLNHLGPEDIVVSNHRCHGHYLVKTDDVDGLIAEQMGRVGGVCGGRGGSQHLCRDGFYSNGVLGSTAPLALGMAMAERQKGTGSIVVLFLGDGAFGEGSVYEAMNMAALWKAPLLMVVENNRYAQTTPIDLNTSGSFSDRAASFGIPSGEIETNDAAILFEHFREIVEEVRTGSGPRLQVVHTYRLNAHSKGDDDRPQDEIDAWRLKDPLTILGERLDADERQSLDQAAIARIGTAEQAARAMAFQDIGDEGVAHAGARGR